MKIGELIKDVEDGDCYFIGQVTEIKKNEVIKYKLLKIIWSGEEDTDCEELNTEIEPRWWYIEKHEK